MMTLELLWIEVVLVFVLTHFGHCDDTGELVMANVLFRHGARSPIFFYKTNKYKNYWPDGKGRLTRKGIQMEYELGKYLKKKYVETKFINKHYLHKEVLIRSSGVDRCLQSAESQLAGLYPPVDWQVWNKDIAWQPIPIQTVPKNEDPVFRPEATKNCPGFEKLMVKMREEPQFKMKLQKNQGLIKYVRSHSGEIDLSPEELFLNLNDCIKAETEEGLAQPDWIVNRLKEIRDLSWYFLKSRYIGQEGTADLLGRLTGGSMLGAMINNMKSYGTKDAARKFNLFSGHDTSILALSAALGNRIDEELPFSAMAIVELYKDSSGQYFVTMNYRHGDKTTPWKLADCDYKCPLDEFILKTKARVPTDREVECQATPYHQRRPTVLSYERICDRDRKRDVRLYLGKELEIISVVQFIFILSLLVVAIAAYVTGRFRKWSKVHDSNHYEKKSLIG